MYKTSPATKAALVELQKTISRLQSELNQTKHIVEKLERRDTHGTTDVEAIVEARLEAFKLTMLAEVERHGVSATNQLTTIEERLINVEASVQEGAEHSQSSRQIEVDVPPTATFATFSSPIPGPVQRAAPIGTPTRPSDENVPPRSLARGKTPRAATKPINAIPSHVRASMGKASSSSRQALEGPASPAPSAAASLGKRGRDSDASTQSVDLAAVRSPPGNASAASATANVSKGHVRKRLRVSERHDVLEDESADDSRAFETVEEGSFVAPRDSVVPLKDAPTLVRSPSRDPSFFASVMAPGTPTRMSLSGSTPSLFGIGITGASGTKSAPPTSRKSLPMTSLPFPIVSPFKSARKSSAATASNAQRLFADASNGALSLSPGARQSLSSIATTLSAPASRPTTPAADRTLYGTETGSRFADVASPYAGPSW